MIQFNKPKNLNGAELIIELKEAGISFLSDGIQSPAIDADGNLLLNIEESDKSKAEVIVANHNGTTTVSELTVEQKLESVGLSINDLKKVLGL